MEDNVDVKNNIENDVENDDKHHKKLPSNYYFDNAKVEALLIQYQNTGCTDIVIRDQIMNHTSDLIISVIRTHNLHTIYGGNDESSFNDLFQIAWQQIESTLYKFNSSPGHSKIFNMWSQIARTSILAAIKKNNRDHKNINNYKYHLDYQVTNIKVKFDRFIKEIKELCQYCDEHMVIIDALETLYYNDDKPYDGLINKLSELTKLSRMRIIRFLKIIKLLCSELSDGPLNNTTVDVIKPSTIICVHDEE